MLNLPKNLDLYQVSEEIVFNFKTQYICRGDT